MYRQRMYEVVSSYLQLLLNVLRAGKRDQRGIRSIFGVCKDETRDEDERNARVASGRHHYEYIESSLNRSRVRSPDVSKVKSSSRSAKISRVRASSKKCKQLPHASHTFTLQLTLHTYIRNVSKMGRELQKKKNRSSTPRATQTKKNRKRLLQHPLIASNWDQSQTLEQNYKRLGLTSKLNKHTGGRERKADDIIRQREQREGDTEGDRGAREDGLAIASRRMRGQRVEIGEVAVERDAQGKIVRVIGQEEGKANPLNDPLNALDSDSEDEGWQGLDQHLTRHVPLPTAAEQTEVVRGLEAEASRHVAKYRPKQSAGERDFVVELVAKYGDDYTAMTRDMKINYMQRSEGDLKRRIKRWRDAGGMLE